MSHPRARIDRIHVTETADGLTIDDASRQISYVLHPVTALVWKHADGKTSIAELAALVRERVDAAATEETIWSALDGLAQAGLLHERLAPPTGAQRFGRRDLIRRVALSSAAAAALTGAVASTDAHAQDISNLRLQEESQKQLEFAREESRKNAAEQASKEGGAKNSREQSVKENPGGFPIDLNPSWLNVGNEFQVASYARHGHVVILGGVIEPFDVSAPESVIGVLAPHLCPASRLIFSAPAYNQLCSGDGGSTQPSGSSGAGSSSGIVSGPGSGSGSASSGVTLPTPTSRDSVRIDILPDGQILLVEGNPYWVSLSGIVFFSSRLEPGDQGDGRDDGRQQEQDAKRAQEQREKAAEQEQEQKRAAEAADKQSQKAKSSEQQRKRG